MNLLSRLGRAYTERAYFYHRWATANSALPLNAAAGTGDAEANS